MKGIEHELDKIIVYLMKITNTLPPELFKEWPQWVRKISDSTPVEKGGKT